MSAELHKDQFVSVVGVVDLEQATGQILYVNPSQVGISGLGAPDGGPVELKIEDAGGAELLVAYPQIRTDSCEANPRKGLIQYDLPVVPGMARILLLLEGKEVARHESAPLAANLQVMGMSPQAGSSSRKLVDLPNIKPEAGVSYTVMVQPEGQQEWQATAVGLDNPKFELDANQFPGVTSVKVKVLQSNGFNDHTIAEETVKLE